MLLIKMNSDTQHTHTGAYMLVRVKHGVKQSSEKTIAALSMSNPSKPDLSRSDDQNSPHH